MYLFTRCVANICMRLKALNELAPSYLSDLSVNDNFTQRQLT